MGLGDKLSSPTPDPTPGTWSALVLIGKDRQCTFDFSYAGHRIVSSPV